MECPTYAECMVKSSGKSLYRAIYDREPVTKGKKCMDIVSMQDAEREGKI